MTATLAPPAQSKERDASRTRVNERLAERLAKATAPKSGGTSAVPSRTGSPAIVEERGASGEKEDAGSTEKGSESVESVGEKSDAGVVGKADESTIESGSLQIASSVDPARTAPECESLACRIDPVDRLKRGLLNYQGCVLGESSCIAPRFF